MRLLQMSLAALLLAGGCSYQTAVVLRNGETVDLLYYHESRMPEEVMVEMWVDFAERRLRFKCSPQASFQVLAARRDGMAIPAVRQLAA